MGYLLSFLSMTLLCQMRVKLLKNVQMSCSQYSLNILLRRQPSLKMESWWNAESMLHAGDYTLKSTIGR